MKFGTGEMAKIARRSPFVHTTGRWIATQLWLMLLLGLCQSYRRSDDWRKEPRPNVERSRSVFSLLLHQDRVLISFATGGKPPGLSPTLSNQGWKDSSNAIVRADGSLAKAPIAVCEAQGYLYSDLDRVFEAVPLS